MSVNVPLGYTQVTLHFTNTAYQGEASVTFGLDVRTATDLPSDWPGNISDHWVSTVHQRMSSAVELVLTTMRMPTESGDVTLEHSSASGGFLSGDIAPPNAAYLVQKRTGFAGKKNRGRMYLPSVLMSSLTSNRSDLVAVGPLGALQTQLDAFLALLEADSTFMVILHQEGIADAPRRVTSLLAVERLATQRGRLRD